MVDFKQKLTSAKKQSIIDPLDIYENLDRASDVGPLRPVQREILERWGKDFKNRKDTIIKLQTGQGKTLIGLLILQSYLNQGRGPALYICPKIAAL